MSYFYPDEINITNETLELQYPSNEINKRHIEKKMNTVANSKNSSLVKCSRGKFEMNASS